MEPNLLDAGTEEYRGLPTGEAAGLRPNARFLMLLRSVPLVLPRATVLRMKGEGAVFPVPSMTAIRSGSAISCMNEPMVGKPPTKLAEGAGETAVENPGD
jgi:hypothetical protein